ncbi:MAG: glycosyltransferase [Myxococcota bacterium]
MLSIIVPAFNEERELPGCLASIGRAVRSAKNVEHELIVVDNNSSDGTCDVARAAGAAVVFEPVNQISRARNAGAEVAVGEWLLFLDADSRLHPDSFGELVDVLRSGTVAGGGCIIALEGVPAWIRAGLPLFNLCMRIVKWAPGCFLFCRADAFRELRGFSTDLFGGEEMDFSRRLKQWARARGCGFRVLARRPHLSSGRKFRLFTTRETLEHLWRSFFRFGVYHRDRSQLAWYYDGRR